MRERTGSGGDLRVRLQQTLSGIFTIDSELGGGGMSRVFVAEETRLGRKVVVKVLSPELAEGISVERFEREIRLAASLQHAHIVPVLTNGEVDGLPYFTMPFIEGESLRARVARGPLPIGECISILRDVARALAYAHGRDVVHRDIKPDNVMFSAASAVVTDFGIAKALSASRTGTGSETLTQLGTSIGTPAYMAPEQAAGDPNVDARADIYAFGCTAYELLTGGSPFAGRTPQRMLAAHMAEAPRSVTELRPDTPPVLADLVMRSLAKDANARPQTAAEIARTLDSITSGSVTSAPAVLLSATSLTRAFLVYAAAFVAVVILAKAAIVGIGLPEWVLPGALIVMALGLPVILLTAYVQRVNRRLITATPTRTPGGTSRIAAPEGAMATLAVRATPYVNWRRTARGGIVAVGGFGCLVAGYMVLRAMGIGPGGSLIGAGKLSNQDRILVADFKATGADSASGGAMAELMRSSLQQSHAVRLMPASAVAGSLERMKLPNDSKLDLPLALQMAKREGVKAVVAGEVTPLAGGSLVTVRLIAASSGDVLWSSQRSVGSASDFVPSMDALARELRAKIGESLKAVQAAPPLAHVTTTSLAALEKFTEGAHATDVEENEFKAIDLLNQAIALDSTFVMAYRKLVVAIENSGLRTNRATDILEKGVKYVDRLPEGERLAYLATYYEYSGAHADRAKAIALYEELFRRFPEWKVIITETLLSSLYVSRQEYARGESLDVEITRAAPDEWSPYSNIVTPELHLGEYDKARASIARDRARQGSNTTADWRTGELMYAMDKPDSARYYWNQTIKGGGLRAVEGHNDISGLALSEGRIADAERERAAGEALNLTRGQPLPSAYARALDSAEAELLILHRPDQALAMIATGVQHAPRPRAPSLRAARLYAIAGRMDSARAELARYDAAVTDTAALRINRYARDIVVGWIAVGEQRYPDAIASFRASARLPDGPRSSCGNCTDFPVGTAFDRAGMSDSAIAVYEHFLHTPITLQFFDDSHERPNILRRLGELYEGKGDRAHAATYYQQFIDRWKNADAVLQPQVAEVRARLARLGDAATTVALPKKP